MSLNVQIVGGRHDGKIVPYVGPHMRVPVPMPRPAWIGVREDISPADCLSRDELYDLHHGFDGELYYVLATP